MVRKSHSEDMGLRWRPAQSEGVSCLQGKACQGEGTACAKALGPTQGISVSVKTMMVNARVLSAGNITDSEGKGLR